MPMTQSFSYEMVGSAQRPELQRWHAVLKDIKAGRSTGDSEQPEMMKSDIPAVRDVGAAIAEKSANCDRVEPERLLACAMASGRISQIELFMRTQLDGK